VDLGSEDEAEIVLPLGESELSLEEIIARAEAQDALFPSREPLSQPAPAVPSTAPPAEPADGPPVEPSEAGKPAEPFTAEEKPFDRSDTQPLVVLTGTDADTLAAALDDEGWPEGLELPGLEEPERGKP
jgi:hypothetical protein